MVFAFEKRQLKERKLSSLLFPGSPPQLARRNIFRDLWKKLSDFKEIGVDTITCISVNDAFVMKTWKENLKMGDAVLLLSNGNGTSKKPVGCELDLSDKPMGLGVRSRRYAILEDGVVKILKLADVGAFNVSRAEGMLKALTFDGLGSFS